MLVGDFEQLCACCIRSLIRAIYHAPLLRVNAVLLYNIINCI
jgi:hypothetical protein